MGKVKLGDICDVRDGTHDSPKYCANGYPLITSKNLSDGFIDLSECNLISEEDYTKINIRSKVDVGDILMPMIGTVGNPVIVEIEPEFAIKNIALIKFKKESNVFNKYIKVLLESGYFDRTIISKIRGGTQKFISLSDIRNLEINLPAMKEQQDIVNKIEKVNNLINNRKKQLEKLDQFIKVRFVELFGDPIDNPLNWKISDFKDVVYFQEGPGVRNWQFRDNGIKLINIRNLVDDNLVLENTNNYLSEQEVEEKYKHFLLDIGDYVMASSGVTWGKIAEIYEEHLPLCLNTSIIRLRPYDENVISKKYLFHYIKGDAFRTQIKRLITGSAQPNFGPTHLKQISILVPPIELQNQFAAFVEQTDKSKLLVQKSLDKLELLKKALMQKFFE